MEIQTRAAFIRGIDEGNRAVRVIASTNEVDRYESRILQHWDLSGFELNPVALWMHNHQRPPIGRVENWETAEDLSRSEADIRFADTDFGNEIFQLYVQEILKAVSVGFMPGKIAYGEDDIAEIGSPDLPNELLELSPVTVPGNKGAVVVTNSAALLESDAFLLLREMQERQISMEKHLKDLYQQIAAGADVGEIEEEAAAFIRLKG